MQKIVILISSMMYISFPGSAACGGSHASREEPYVPSYTAESASIQAEGQENRIATAYFDSAHKRLLLFFASGAILARQEETDALLPLEVADTGIKLPDPGDTIPLFGEVFPLRFDDLNALFFITKNCHLTIIIGTKVFPLGSLQPKKPPIIDEVTLRPNPYRIIDIKAIVPFGENRILLCTTGKLHIALSFSETEGNIIMESAWIRLYHMLSALTYIKQKSLFVGGCTDEHILPGKIFRRKPPFDSYRWWLDNFWSMTKEIPALGAGNKGDKIAVASSEDTGSIIRILYCFEHGNRINWSELLRAALISGEVWRMVFSEDDRWLIVYYTVRFTPHAAVFDLATGTWNQILQQDEFKNVHPVFVTIRDNQLLVVGADGTIAKRNVIDDSPPLLRLFYRR